MPSNLGADRLKEAIALLSECARTCQACADACLAEEHVENLRNCIVSDHACSELCQTLAKLLTMQTAPNKQLLSAVTKACELACRICAEDCEYHADEHEHCMHCGQMCRECEKLCRALAG